MTRSDALEVAIKLPAGDRAVVDGLFATGGVQVMLHDDVAERGAGGLAGLQAGGRLTEAQGDPGEILGLVRVAGERCWRLQLLLDAVEAGRDRGGERQVRVHVGAGDPVLQPDAARPAADKPEAERPIVAAPGDAGRGEGGRDV